MNKNHLFLSRFFFRILDNFSQAANNAFDGRMRPANREFETPVSTPFPIWNSSLYRVRQKVDL